MLVGLLPYLLVVLVTRVTVPAPYWPLCTDCDQEKRHSLRFGLGALAGAVTLCGIGIVLTGSTTSVVDAYGSTSTEPAPVAPLGVLLLLVALVVLSLGVLALQRSRVSGAAAGVVTPDGLEVVFPMAHPQFAQQVAERLKDVRAPTWGSATEPDELEPPSPGHPAP